MSFSVTVQPSGRQFQTGSDETILAAGMRQGIGLPYGCKDGACGSCKCKKLSGEVRMDPYQAKALSEAENMLQAGEKDDALALYQEVLDQDPANVKALAGIMRTHLALGQEQAARDQRNWEAQQAEDQRRYDEMMGMQREQWQAQQQLRAPYRAASQRLLNGAFGDTSVIRPYPGASLGDLMSRG